MTAFLRRLFARQVPARQLAPMHIDDLIRAFGGEGL